MTNWFEVDGEKLADEIFRKLVFSENGELTRDNVFDIYEAFYKIHGQHIFRKTEFYAWKKLGENLEVKREGDILVWLPRKLKDLTGAGMLDCRSAIKKCDGDLEKAKTYLEEKFKNARLITLDWNRKPLDK